MGDYEQSSKYRKFSHSHSVHDQVDPGSVRRVQFQNNHSDIVLDRRDFQVCTPAALNYDSDLLRSPDNWHHVTITHNGNATKTQLLVTLEKITNDAIFIPIAYRNGAQHDSFYVINQPRALELLIEHRLSFVIKRNTITLTVKLGVARYHSQQINPLHQVSELISRNLATIHDGTFDLADCCQGREFHDLEFSLRNESNFDFFCSSIVEQLGEERLRVLILSKNSIRRLRPLAHFRRCPGLMHINLRNNSITQIRELEHLQCLRLQELSVGGNPFANDDSIKINEQIMVMLPSLQLTDLSQRGPSVEQKPALVEEVITASDIDDHFRKEFPRRESVKRFWSRVVIEHGGRVKGRKVLDALFSKLFDHVDCFPSYYGSGDREDSFMLYMNFAPLNVLVQNRLRVSVVEGEEAISFRLHLNCSPVTRDQDRWEEVIPRVVAKRITAEKLSLSKFASDPELKNIIVNLSTVNGLRYVLTCALNQSSTIAEVDLSHNGLEMTGGLDVLKEHTHLVTLDLSHNNIQTLEGFPEGLQLSELQMEGNPVCGKFILNNMQSALIYVKVFKKLCPNLAYIDERKINQEFKIVNSQNFCLTPKAYMTVEHFIKFFFEKHANQQKRQHLGSIYNTKSQLTVSSGNSKKHLFGQVEIMDFYSELPEIEHDYATMTIDTPAFYSIRTPRAIRPDTIQIVVSGVFRHKQEGSELFSFTRTFFLKKDANGTGRAKGTLSNTFYFEIVNEILHYERVVHEELRGRAFRSERATPGEIESAFTNETMENQMQEFEENLEMLRQTIMMKPEWCKRFLEEANGDFRTALNYFIEFFKRNLLRNEDFCFK